MERRNLLQEVLTEGSELLAKEGIYAVLDYGWEGEDTPSDEFVGLAMWTTDAPFKPDYFFWNRPTAPPLPSARDEVFYKSAEDFFGTMDLALNALALTRYSYELRKAAPILDDEELFWEHHASTAVWLNIASDRLREYVIMARFGLTREQFKGVEKQHKDRGFPLPFKLTGTDEGEHATQAGDQLAQIAEQLRKQRDLRNELVHEIASRRGLHALQTVGNQKIEAMRTPFAPRVFDISKDGLADAKAASESLFEVKESELRKALTNLREWYTLLVKAASLTFEFEYWKRIGK